MNKYDKFSIRWVGRCQYDSHDKIWGWFFYNPEGMHESAHKTCHVFWGRTGKTVSFKTHPYDKWFIKRLSVNKRDKGYKQISVENLETIWPSFFADVENRFVLHILKQG
jgi:hypothetical protein